MHKSSDYIYMSVLADSTDPNGFTKEHTGAIADHVQQQQPLAIDAKESKIQNRAYKTKKIGNRKQNIVKKKNQKMQFLQKAKNLLRRKTSFKGDKSLWNVQAIYSSFLAKSQKKVKSPEPRNKTQKAKNKTANGLAKTAGPGKYRDYAVIQPEVSDVLSDFYENKTKSHTEFKYQIHGKDRYTVLGSGRSTRARSHLSNIIGFCDIKTLNYWRIW
ncbi:hypothetical protein BX070DRAFT_235636 [Coemansia spiralis]|nr:hypothetical protein BX070DRAFT_235636 [Coemansia spiralis]